MKYLIRFSYDGTDFYGYQKQNNKKTIQGDIESALEIRFGKHISIYSSGRTDRCVHAINQYAHFEIDKEIDTYKLIKYLNDKLDDAIYIKDIKKVKDDFHARFSYKEKTYMYIINDGEYDVTRRNYELFVNKKFDISKFNDIILLVLGNHDFENFTTVQDKKDNYVRTIYDIKIKRKNNRIYFYISGNGFLRYMVRNIIGCFLMYENGSITKTDIKNMLNKKVNIKPVKVEGKGLYLYDVKY